MKKNIKKIIPFALINKYHYLWSLLGAFIYRFPSKKIKVIGVTGTNGKSTVVYLLAQMLKKSGHKVALSSSIEFWVGDRAWSNRFKMTMPGRFFIQKFLRTAVKEKCDYAIIEVTSEGILQHRHEFIDFDVVILTNISPEHIERHGGYDKYKKAKGKLFSALSGSHKKNKIIIVNLADKEAGYFLSYPADRRYGFHTSDTPDISTAKDSFEVVSNHEVVAQEGISFKIGNIQFKSRLQGKFNIENLLAVIAAGLSQGFNLKDMSAILSGCDIVPGRLEKIDNPRNVAVYVDYAHTPAALTAAYSTLGAHSQLICVLGATGGGRDKWKRPELGKIAGQYCKKIFLTNEDPYDEDPMDIIKAVEEGVNSIRYKKTNYEIVLDRKEAIIKAIQEARIGDAVIITGKGSENLMMLADGKKINWDDRIVVKSAD